METGISIVEVKFWLPDWMIVVGMAVACVAPDSELLTVDVRT